MKAFNLISITFISLLGLVFVSACVYAICMLCIGNAHNGFTSVG